MSRTSLIGAEPHKGRIPQRDMNCLCGLKPADSGGISRKTLPVSMLLQRFPCNAASAAFSAAVCVMAALAADAGHGAAAQTRLDAEYTATLSGLPIGRGNWVIEITDDQYSAAASGLTSGLLRVFTSARGTGTTRGSFNGEQLIPASYVATIDWDRKVDDVRMVMA